MPDDVWDEYPRLCGTFDERTSFPCQMPESLLARITRVSSNEGNWILDPFSGSGTTAVVAHKLKRVYTGVEISKNYVIESEKRIKESEGLPVEGEGKIKWSERLEAELKWIYHENKVPTEQLANDPSLLALFTDKFNKRIGIAQNLFQPKQIIRHLIQMRKNAKLGPLRGHPIIRKAEKSESERILWENGVIMK